MFRKFFIKAFLKSANLLSKDETFISSKNLRVIPWFRDNGDNTHSLDHNLDENSLVFDMGGYLGEWSKLIDARYHCNIHIFEPVSKFYTHIKENLISDKILVNQYGLAPKTYKTEIGISNEASSLYKKGDQSEMIQLVDFMDYINNHQIGKIDLIKINIEGAEYDLLEYLVKTGFVKKIINIQVQFHDIFPDAELRMKNIQTSLSKTHLLTYQYPFIWENWQLK